MNNASGLAPRLFTSRVYLAVIDSQIIVNAYKVKREADSQPIRIDYYNDNLELVDYTLIPSTESMRISPVKIQNGRGDYFFMVGSFIDFNGDLTYGYLSKVGKSGDIIWEHYYQHPDFLDENILYSLRDIFEEENGDIYCLGSIFSITTQQELWLFKIAKNGCFGTDSCAQEVILSTDNNTPFDNNNINIYPNPTSDILNIQSVRKISSFEIYDIKERSILVEQDINGKGNYTATLSFGLSIIYKNMIPLNFHC